MKRMLLGIGNRMHGDDGAGPHVARRLRGSAWHAIDCGTAPENFTSVVRREAPDLLVLVDAARMGLSPGEFRIVPPERIEGVVVSTHRLPLSRLVGFLSPLAGRILLIGIEPGDLSGGESLSPLVIRGAERLIKILERGSIGEIETLPP